MNPVTDRLERMLAMLATDMNEALDTARRTSEFLEGEVSKKEYWEGTPEEVENRKKMWSSFLDQYEKMTGLVPYRFVRMRAQVQTKYVPDEELKKSFQCGYETGLKWGDGKNDNYRPGGPFRWTETGINPKPEQVTAALKSQRSSEQWFLGFDTGLARRDELGMYVPRKARKCQ